MNETFHALTDYFRLVVSRDTGTEGSSLALLTPADVHHGRAQTILDQRQRTLDAAPESAAGTSVGSWV
jgi:hypothetical protein